MPIDYRRSNYVIRQAWFTYKETNPNNSSVTSFVAGYNAAIRDTVKFVAQFDKWEGVCSQCDWTTSGDSQYVFDKCSSHRAETEHFTSMDLKEDENETKA